MTFDHIFSLPPEHLKLLLCLKSESGKHGNTDDIVESTVEIIISKMEYFEKTNRGNLQKHEYSKDKIYRLLNQLEEEKFIYRCSKNGFIFKIFLSKSEVQSCNSTNHLTTSGYNEKSTSRANESCNCVNNDDTINYNEKHASRANESCKCETNCVEKSYIEKSASRANGKENKNNSEENQNEFSSNLSSGTTMDYNNKINTEKIKNNDLNSGNELISGKDNSSENKNDFSMNLSSFPIISYENKKNTEKNQNNKNEYNLIGENKMENPVSGDIESCKCETNCEEKVYNEKRSSRATRNTKTSGLEGLFKTLVPSYSEIPEKAEEIPEKKEYEKFENESLRPPFSKKRITKQKSSGYITIKEIPKIGSEYTALDIKDWLSRHFIKYYRDKYEEYWENKTKDFTARWKEESPNSPKAIEDLNKIRDQFILCGFDNFSNINLAHYIDWFFRERYKIFLKWQKEIGRNNRLKKGEEIAGLFGLSILSRKTHVDAYIRSEKIVNHHIENKQQIENEEQINPNIEKDLEYLYDIGISDSLMNFGIIITAKYMKNKDISDCEILRNIDEKIKHFYSNAIKERSHLRDVFKATIKYGPYPKDELLNDWRERYKSLKNKAFMEENEYEYNGDYKIILNFLFKK